MQKIFITSTIITFLIFTHSCKKKVERIDVNAFWECNIIENNDSAKLAKKLIGTWKLTKQSCFSSAKTFSVKKVVMVEFMSSGAYTLSINSIVTKQGPWKLKEGANNTFSLDLKEPCEYLYGMILLCDKEVLFSNSHLDGCDNLFVKIR